MAAILNMVGAFLSQNVAATVGKGIVTLPADSQTVVLAALIGAITWNLITWRFGIPSSSSHALIGGLVGATLVAVGTSGVEWSGLWHKVDPAHGHLAGDRPARRLRVDEPAAAARVPLVAAPREPHVSPAAARLGGRRRPGPRLQRRPEDDGRHHPRADHLGPPAAERADPRLGDRRGGAVDGASARTSAAGASSAPSAPRSSTSTRSTASRPRPPRPP